MWRSCNRAACPRARLPACPPAREQKRLSVAPALRDLGHAMLKRVAADSGEMAWDRCDLESDLAARAEAPAGSSSSPAAPLAEYQSSSVIVPVAVASGTLALLALLSVTVNVSLSSSAVSPVTATFNVFEVSLAAKVSVPLPAV